MLLWCVLFGVGVSGLFRLGVAVAWLVYEWVCVIDCVFVVRLLLGFFCLVVFLVMFRLLVMVVVL